MIEYPKGPPTNLNLEPVSAEFEPSLRRIHTDRKPARTRKARSASRVRSKASRRRIATHQKVQGIPRAARAARPAPRAARSRRPRSGSCGYSSFLGPQDRRQPGTALREIEHSGVKEQAGLLRPSRHRVRSIYQRVHDDCRAAHLRENDCVAGHVGLELRNPCPSHVFEIS
jgi:hypothetical protein